MATPILDLSPFPGAASRLVFDGVDEFQEDGQGEVRAHAACAIPYHVFSWPTADYPELLATLRQFARARHLNGECFYVLDPRDSMRFDVEVGPAVGAQQTFELPTDDGVDAYRDFPIDGTVSATVAGVPRTVSLVSTDARRVRLATAASDGQAVKISYQAYRLCRLPTSIEISHDEADWDAVRLEIREVMRDPKRRIAAPDVRYATPFTWPISVSIGTVLPTSIGGPVNVYSIVSGALPTGVGMLFSAGSLTGTPSAAGSGSVTIRATGPGGTSDVVVAWTVTP